MAGSDGSYVFISHKCDDHEVAYRIVEELEALGVRSWIDERDIPVGADWSDELQEKLQGAAAVMWIKSPASATSDEVLKELKVAEGYKKPIIPLEVTRVEKLAAKWSFLMRYQVVAYSRQGWADRIARALAELDGFELSPIPGAAPESNPSTSAESRSRRVSTTAKHVDAPSEHDPFAIVLSDGQLYQLDALNGLGENLVDADAAFGTGELGSVFVAADASVIATCDNSGVVELWTFGAPEATRGPVLSEVLPIAQATPRLLAVDRPLGQDTRVIACVANSVYSLTQRLNGGWTAMSLIEDDEMVVSGVIVKDDILIVRESGGTGWASSGSKRPFSLRNIHGVDAAIGSDGRYYLAAWGCEPGGASAIEVVVEADSGWERVHRGPGGRAGIVRVMPDLVLQTGRTTKTSVIVEQDDHSVSMLTLD